MEDMNKTKTEKIAQNHVYIVGKRKDIPIVNTISVKEIEELKRILKEFLSGDR